MVCTGVEPPVRMVAPSMGGSPNGQYEDFKTLPGDGKKPHIIVFANEKGGTGKSTTAVHVAIALAMKGGRVAAFDLDHRQRTVGRYLDNRAVTVKRTGRELVTPRHATHDGK